MFFVDVPGGIEAGDRVLVYSATDLVRAAECPWATVRILDEKLGRVPRLPVPEDPMLERTARLGDRHEAEVLAELRERYGPYRPAAAGAPGRGVYEVEPARSMTHEALAAKHEETLAALRNGADVVFQASFYDGRFHGRADFLIRRADGAYAVYDTKLARHAKVTALLQLAAYADQLAAAGIPVSPEVTLILGDRREASFEVERFLEVYRERRERFEALTAKRRRPGAAPADWWEETLPRCGVCPHCLEQIQENQDVLQVAGMTLARRTLLRERHGVRTVADLAHLPEDDAHLSGSLRAARAQAQMQLGEGSPDGEVTYRDSAGEEHRLSYAVTDAAPLRRIPRAAPGDVFFDFEGDPLWQDPEDGSWGIEYLFGVVEAPEDPALLADPGHEPRFVPFWAHSRREERRALLDFLEYIAERRRRYPQMRIYHYADYEKRALRSLAMRHGVGEEAVDDLLRQEVLVDLYEPVRRGLRISAPSYSIKKLEPLYMGEHLRAGDVTDAGASVVAYADYAAHRDADEPEQARRILASIADYNEYDCLSTLRLRNWLLDLAGRDAAAEACAPDPAAPHPEAPEDEDAEVSAVEASLTHFAQHATTASTGLDEAELARTVTAAGMVASATGYHRRERKQFWWSHFDRLASAVQEWESTRDVVLFDRVTVAEDWHTPPRGRTERRVLEGTARIPDGSSLRGGESGLFAMYDSPLPGYLRDQVLQAQERRGQGGGAAPVPERASQARATLEEIEPGPQEGTYRVRVTETRPADSEAFAQLPMALTPPAPIRTQAQEDALAALAEEVDAALPHLPADAGLDILSRRSPRLRSGGALPAPDWSAPGLPMVEAILAAVLDLDRSYVAVQGPPGTGKSFVGAHVIGRLVQRGWRIGVVAQSHAVIENLLRGCARHGRVPREAMAKAKPRRPRGAEQVAEPTVPWRRIGPQEIPDFLAGEDDEVPVPGRVYGGTAWDFANAERFSPGQLDLLVIDEAGQYSLANMLAVSRAARNLLLLGDPQQLPQVTQGTHPYSVDESALGWLSAGEQTLPPQLGYFLDATWRMHPSLCAPVSRLSYRGRLHAAEAAGHRRLAGLAPGVHRLEVEHTGRATASPEEADAVVQVARTLVGRPWTPGTGRAPRPLEASDLLVVAAYNAQVEAIRHALGAAGLTGEDDGVRVGTVDKFQGQEAAVAIVSMAASSAAEVPRGMDFLLSPNRLNVAVSRGQWAAVLISSPALTDYWPASPEGLAVLGGFTGLRRRALPWREPTGSTMDGRDADWTGDGGEADEPG